MSAGSASSVHANIGCNHQFVSNDIGNDSCSFAPYRWGVARHHSNPELQVDAFGEAALLARIPDQALVHAVTAALVADLQAGHLLDVVPGDGTLLIRFDGTDAGEADARRRLAAAFADPPAPAAPRWHEIPVRYGGNDGPDLASTAALAGLNPERLIELHAGREYTVRFLGFAPGFAYLGDLAPELVVRRLDVPRTTTPAGSVAIAEGYTGIYPASLPGGWRIIGRTDAVLFDPDADPPTAFLPGDTVRFRPHA
jgi:KipI family sensor histidine kinase inhibitor